MSYHFKNKKNIKIVIVILMTLFFFSQVNVVFAKGEAWNSFSKNTVDGVLGNLASLATAVGGGIIGLAIDSVIGIARYNNFINEKSIVDAWKILRDFCNMLFILVLLVIAFASILRLENYSMKRYLPKVVIMAVLINFSRTIVGILIDASQIVMLTFVNSFLDAGGNFVSFLQVDKFLKTTAEANLEAIAVAKTYLLVLIFTIIATIAILSILLVFVMRVIFLWIYVALSPLAFLLMAFPGGERYARQYWSDFTKYLINGPVLAFFIWLALSVLDNIDIDKFTSNNDAVVAGSTFIAGSAGFMSFVLAIAFLVGGLVMSSQIGGLGASWGAGMVTRVKNTGMNWAKRPFAMGWQGAKSVTYKAGRAADDLQIVAQKKVASKFGHDNYQGKSLNYRMIKEGWQKNKAESIRKYEQGKSSNWAATFDQYADMKQYGAWRKGSKKIISDEEKAKKLDEENKRLYERMELADLTGDKESDMLLDLTDSDSDEYKKRLTKYIGQANNKLSKNDKEEWAEKEIKKDLEAVQGSITKNDIEKQKDVNSAEAKQLRDHVKFSLFGMDHGKFQPKDSVFKKSAIMDAADKEQADMKKRTDGKDYLVASEILTAMKEKDESKLTAGLRIMAENNDLNELLKDSRFMDIMTEQNGILEKLANEGHFGDHVVGDKDAIKAIKDDFRKNPVTPAYVQAITQGLYKKIGVNDGRAAQHAAIVGNRSIAAGNTLAFGMSDIDTTTGQYKFDQMNYDTGTGKVSSSNGRQGAMVGKYNNFESQARMRNLHPDALMKENMNGDAVGIHEAGEKILKSLTFHDLSQIKRLRGDLIAKLAQSKESMRDIDRIVQELEAEGNHDQAKIIKNFTAYIHSKHSGSGATDTIVDNLDEVYKDAVDV